MRCDTKRLIPGFPQMRYKSRRNAYLVLDSPAGHVNRRRGHGSPIRQAWLPEHVASEGSHAISFHDFLPLLQHRRLHEERGVYSAGGGGGQQSLPHTWHSTPTHSLVKRYCSGMFIGQHTHPHIRTLLPLGTLGQRGKNAVKNIPRARANIS